MSFPTFNLSFFLESVSNQKKKKTFFPHYLSGITVNFLLTTIPLS